jgi:hypothetical protein
VGRLPFALAVSISTAASSAAAADLAANAGVFELVALDGPEHVGVYTYVAGSLVVPTDAVTIVPGLGIEWSPDLGAWGFFSSLVADFPVGESLGVDAILLVIHDQLGDDFAGAAFYAGLGGGVSWILGRWAVSPSLVVYHGLDVDGWTGSLGVNVSLTP